MGTLCFNRYFSAQVGILERSKIIFTNILNLWLTSCFEKTFGKNSEEFAWNPYIKMDGGFYLIHFSINDLKLEAVKIQVSKS